MKPKVKVTYPEQVLMKDQPVGTVFTTGTDGIAVKIRDGVLLNIGDEFHGKEEAYTPSCRAFVVKRLFAEV